MLCEDVPPLQYDRASRRSVMGGMNYHVEVRFEDGISWLAQTRRFNATSPPPALRDFIIQSEVATLKFLEQTNVPAPTVYDFALDCPSNPVGVGYILLEKLPGTSLRWSITTKQQRQRIIGQLANVLIELRKYPFPRFGCLDKPGQPHVGPFARESLTDYVGCEMRTVGPFLSLEEYHASTLRLILNLIVRKESYTQRPVDAFLIHRFLLDLIPRVLPSTQENEKFYLKHADNKGDHILVDADFNITGIVDWEWAHTAPLAHAFNSPIGFLPVSDFYDGKNYLGEEEVIFARLLEERGHLDLARCVWDGRLQHRFTFCCGYDLEDWGGFLGLFRGLREAVGVDQGLEWDEWKDLAMRRYSSDERLQLLIARGKDEHKD
ncbi:kinase-like domain [Paramyrothecium foliicola]|nr:kinase-like domain [Paramyrothecium foliicola]